ncbi:MAG: TIGR04283 family arsenosugar biosynthesis glycosyltransferase [Alphaproteobacteria bacterium]|nr:TIGR04283 family arsenosugar biosynthesis glycosyltransferase [Alphaproteobacteria bacterium]
MISVVIPTLNAEPQLARCLAALIPATLEGMVRQVIIADGGSTDGTEKIADETGADLVRSASGRGRQIHAGIEQTRSPWLLILHADTILQPGWDHAAGQFMQSVDTGRRPISAAAFSFALDDDGLWPRILEGAVKMRGHLAKRPYGDQGLLIPRRLYDKIGGYRPLDIMEDLDIVRRLGRRRLTILKPQALTSAQRYRHDGYLKRIARNQTCLLMHACGMPNSRIARFYSSSPTENAPETVNTPATADRPAPSIKSS